MIRTIIWIEGLPTWVNYCWTVATVINAVGYGWVLWEVVRAWWRSS